MTAGGITSFTLGTDNLNNNLNPTGPFRMLNLAGSLGLPGELQYAPVDARRVHPGWYPG